jgi:hypothetical protein
MVYCVLGGCAWLWLACIKTKINKQTQIINNNHFSCFIIGSGALPRSQCAHPHPQFRAIAIGNRQLATMPTYITPEASTIASTQMADGPG